MKPVLMLLASLVLLVMVFVSGVLVAANVIAEPEPHKFAHMDTPDLWTAKPQRVDTAGQNYERIPGIPQPASVVANNNGSTQFQATAIAATSASATIDGTVTAAIDPSETTSIPDQPNQPPAPVVEAAQAQWCYARYRSYRVEDNSYQPYDGGPRRQCQAPGSRQNQVAARSQRAEAADLHGSVNVSATARREVEQIRQVTGRPVPQQSVAYEDDEMIELPVERYNEFPRSAEVGGRSGSHEEWCAGRYRSYRVGDNSYQPFEGGPRRQCQSPFG